LDVVEGAGYMIEKARHRKDLVTVGTLTRTYLQTGLYHIFQVLREVIGNGVVLAADDLGVETFHSGGTEWRLLGNYLVQHAAKRPNVTPVIVGHVLPNFGTGVVRRASLCSEHPSFRNFGNIQVTKLYFTPFGDE